MRLLLLFLFVFFISGTIFSIFACLINEISLWCIVCDDEEDIKERKRVRENISLSKKCLILSVSISIISYAVFELFLI